MVESRWTASTSPAARIARRHDRHERRARRDRLAEQEVERDPADSGEDRDREGRDRRRIRAATTGGLAVPAGPVAGEHEQDRGRPERAEAHHVHEQAGDEARDRAGDRSCDERDRDDRDEQQVGLGADEARPADRGDLQDRCDEHEHRDPHRQAHGPPRSWGTSTSTASRAARSANGVTWTWV